MTRNPRTASVIRARTWAVALVLTLSACGLFQSREDELREEIIETALDQIGEDYLYGGADPDDGFDCSGLVFYSYREAGIKLPRSSTAQRKAGSPVPLKQALPGDLLFYDFGAKKRSALHVAIYLGDEEAVHAPTSDGEVEVIRIGDRAWRERFVGAVRVLR